MKKTYINPAMVVVPFIATQPIANSISSISGITDLDWGTDPTPAEADIKVWNDVNVWDDEW